MQNIERRRHQEAEEDNREIQAVRQTAGSPADNIRPEVAARIIHEVLSPTPGQSRDSDTRYQSMNSRI